MFQQFYFSPGEKCLKTVIVIADLFGCVFRKGRFHKKCHLIIKKKDGFSCYFIIGKRFLNTVTIHPTRFHRGTSVKPETQPKRIYTQQWCEEFQ